MDRLLLSFKVCLLVLILSFPSSHLDVGVASEALEAVNGYLVRDKPLVISYGH